MNARPCHSVEDCKQFPRTSGEATLVGTRSALTNVYETSRPCLTPNVQDIRAVVRLTNSPKWHI